MIANTIIKRLKTLEVETLTVTTLTSIIITIQTNQPMEMPRNLRGTTLMVTITTMPLNRQKRIARK